MVEFKYVLQEWEDYEDGSEIIPIRPKSAKSNIGLPMKTRSSNSKRKYQDVAVRTLIKEKRKSMKKVEKEFNERINELKEFNEIRQKNILNCSGYKMVTLEEKQRLEQLKSSYEASIKEKKIRIKNLLHEITEMTIEDLKSKQELNVENEEKPEIKDVSTQTDFCGDCFFTHGEIVDLETRYQDVVKNQKELIKVQKTLYEKEIEACNSKQKDMQEKIKKLTEDICSNECDEKTKRIFYREIFTKRLDAHKQAIEMESKFSKLDLEFIQLHAKNAELISELDYYMHWIRRYNIDIWGYMREESRRRDYSRRLSREREDNFHGQAF